MIRSNLIVRRMATAVGSRNFAPCTASITSSSVDALTHNYSASLSSFAPSAVGIATPRQFSSAATELGSILQREIDEETEAAAEQAADGNGNLPPELAELDAEIRTQWTVLEGISGIGGASSESGSGATMRMFRKEAGSKGAKIGIVFHCQDTEEDVQFDENSIFDDQASDESADGDDEEEEEAAQAVRFGVTVSKGGKTVVLQCRSGSEGDVSVESVMVRDGDAESVLTALAGGENVHAALYQGPEFTELAEDLQESFTKYVVEECGVDENVAAYISMYSDYCEQEEYVSWMKTAIDILD